MEKTNLVSECWVVYVVEGPYVRCIPTIYLTKPEIRADQRREKHDNPFEARKTIHTFLGTWLPVRVAA